MNEQVKRELKKGIIGCVIMLVIYISMRYLLPLLIPFFIAFFWATLCKPIKDKMIRKGLGKTLSTSVLIISSVLFFFLVIGGLFWLILKEGCVLRENISLAKMDVDSVVHSCCDSLDQTLKFESGTTYMNGASLLVKVRESCGSYYVQMIKKVTAFFGQGISLIVLIFTTLVAMFFFLRDYDQLRQRADGSTILLKCLDGLRNFLSVAVAYTKAQVYISAINLLIFSVVFWLIKMPCPLVLALFITLIDLLPVLGCGMILIPWALVMMLLSHFWSGTIILVTFLMVLFVRNVIEPKVVGKKIGMGTLFTFVAMYIGYQLFGMAGFILGPIGALVFVKIMSRF